MQNELCGIFVVTTIIWDCCRCYCCGEEEERGGGGGGGGRGEGVAADEARRARRPRRSATHQERVSGSLPFPFLLCWGGGFQAAPKAII